MPFLVQPLRLITLFIKTMHYFPASRTMRLRMFPTPLLVTIPKSFDQPTIVSGVRVYRTLNGIARVEGYVRNFNLTVRKTVYSSALAVFRVIPLDQNGDPIHVRNTLLRL